MISKHVPRLSELTAYLLIVVALIVFIVDISCILTKNVYHTVSTKIRILDVEYGNLLAWLFLALWLHLFIPINSLSIDDGAIKL